MGSTKTDLQIKEAVKAAAPSLDFVVDTRNTIVVTTGSGQKSVGVTFNLDTPIPLVGAIWGGGPLVIQRTARSRAV